MLRLLVMAIVACIVSLTLAAHATPKEEAEKHFRAGVSLQKVEDFESAIVAFEASLRLFPTKSALFNLANCYKATHRYADALEALDRLREEHGADLQEPMLGAVESLSAELENLTAWLVVDVDQVGANILVDGEPVGQAPLPARLRLGVGAHQIRVSLEGYTAETRTVSLASRSEVTERFDLEPLAPDVPASPTSASGEAPSGTSSEHASPGAPPAVRDEGASALTATGWITTGVGALLLLGGTTTGIWALAVDGELSGVCEEERCPSDRGDQINTLDTLATTTNVLLSAGALVTAAGVMLLLIEGTSSSRGTEGSGPRPDFDFALGPGYMGVSVGRGF